MELEYRTPSISIKIEPKEKGMAIDVEILDEEVFPPIDFGNKKIADKSLHLIANQLQAMLGGGMLTPKRAAGPAVVSVTCDGCGHTFQIEAPCGGCKEAMKITCPKCEKPLVLQWKRSS